MDGGGKIVVTEISDGDAGDSWRLWWGQGEGGEGGGGEVIVVVR